MNKFHTRVFLMVIMGLFFFATQGNAQFTITENFKGNNVGSNIIMGGNPEAYLTSGKDDPVNDGWLRLTKDAGNQRGYAYIDNSFPSTFGIYVEFEYKTWRSHSSSADGICIFLFDADTPEFRIGAFGGSLGYAPSTNNGGVPGLAGAYLGVGFDEWGNFGTNQEGKDGTTDARTTNTVTMRGPEKPTITTKNPYRLLKSVKSNDFGGNIAYDNTIQSRPTDNQFYRRVRIYIEPEDGQYRLRVQWTTTPNGAFTQLMDYLTEDVPPENLKLGFSASTGGFVNYHEIRNVLITTPGDVLVQKEVDKVNVPQNGELTYTVNVINNSTSTSTLPDLILNDVIKDSNGNDIAHGGKFSISTVTFNNKGNMDNTAVGFESGIPRTWTSNNLEATMTLAPSSSASFIIKGTLNGIPDGGRIINTVDITPPDIPDLNDDITNNHSEVSTTVYNPALDLKIEKVADNHGAAKSDGNTFTIIVTNNSSNNKTNGEIVTVTDVIPAGLTVTDYTGKSGGSLVANGWTASVNGSTYTFTRSDALNGLLAYSPIIIKVTANTPTTQLNKWTNTARVNYINDTNPENNEASAILKWYNYWYGTTDNDWAKSENWTANFVPSPGDDIEFATDTNNSPDGYGNGQGEADKDLHLDTDRIIGDLINDSNMDLWVTTNNALTINGAVKDGNPSTGTIIVKADPENAKTNGTLIFTDPGNNQDVQATVEFYNGAYECDDCGFYRNSWQYFGIPVQTSTITPPFTGNHTVNKWTEPANGNKWIGAEVPLKAFEGYEITRKDNTIPTTDNAIHTFKGTLNVFNIKHDVPLSYTGTVNYAGMNLVGNSFTAAIPINQTALQFSGNVDKTVYLFNTGTRDQWRKLNGAVTEGVASGSYISVPINVAGAEMLPTMIPSTHAFMVQVRENATLTLNYSTLVKNQTVTNPNGQQVATRSAQVGTETTEQQLPSLVMDVIGEQSADRVWIFAKKGTTYGFDNGWDGRKMKESGITQLYVMDDTEKDHFQVATVPGLDNLSLGFTAYTDGKYTIEFALSDHWATEEIYLNDLATGTQTRVTNGSSYSFSAKKGDSGTRFSLSASGGIPMDDEAAKIEVNATSDGHITISNNSNRNCTVLISNTAGQILQRLEVAANSEQEMENISAGTYVILLENAVINDVRKIVVK